MEYVGSLEGSHKGLHRQQTGPTKELLGEREPVHEACCPRADQHCLKGQGDLESR